MTRKRKAGSSGATEPVTFETVREIANDLPGAVEGTSYGTPAFHVAKKLFVRMHQDGESLVIKIDFEERAMRIRAEPETFYITDHYRNYPWILVPPFERRSRRSCRTAPGGVAGELTRAALAKRRRHTEETKPRRIGQRPGWLTRWFRRAYNNGLKDRDSQSDQNLRS